MRKSIFWGVAFICAAVLLIIDGVGVGMGAFNDIPVIRIILGVACVAWTVNELWKKRIAHIFFPLSFIFMLFESEIATACGVKGGELMSNWLVLLCALLLTIGTAIIFSKPKDGDKWSKKCFKDHKIMGSSTKYIDCIDFSYTEVECSMGSVVVYFQNIDSYLGDATLKIDNNMGSVLVHVPGEWRINENISNSMGSVSAPKTNTAAGGPVLNIIGENNMGSVAIKSE